MDLHFVRFASKFGRVVGEEHFFDTQLQLLENLGADSSENLFSREPAIKLLNL